MNNIGVYGLGVMGQSLARNIMSKGFTVSIYLPDILRAAMPINTANTKIPTTLPVRKSKPIPDGIRCAIESVIFCPSPISQDKSAVSAPGATPTLKQRPRQAPIRALTASIRVLTHFFHFISGVSVFTRGVWITRRTPATKMAGAIKS